MISNAVIWTYALAPDVEVDPGHGGAFLRTATGQTWIETAGDTEVLELLAGVGSSEVQIRDRLRPQAGESSAETRCAALLFRLDRLGLLARGLSGSGRRLASSVPLRPPPHALLEYPPDEPLQLSPRAIAHAEGNGVTIETPGSWARMVIHDRELLPLLYDLAVARPAADIAAAAIGHSDQAILAVLTLMNRCGLLDRADHEGWSGHDLFFHARTRKGYARIPLGKTCPKGKITDQPASSTKADGLVRVALELPDLPRLLADDPPYAMVCERRQSARRQGLVALTSGQLSEFLFRTLHERGGRRPYPSGGACYPLKAYLAVHSCRGIVPGLYAYDSAVHDLALLGKPGAGLDRLLADAAAAAGVERPPQILIMLAACFVRTTRSYGDLSYSLILKEVGAVFQAAMMAGTAMGLATCPLGCGDSLLFSKLVGTDPLMETSVGELMLGSLEEAV
jgi:SagB-type dehydrogenase family enzyme